MAQKLAEIYEQVSDKASFFGNFIFRIFAHSPIYRFLSHGAIFKGFYFMFIYKDFIVRDLVTRMRESLP